jgi:CheY-like chemotaxis protein
LDLSKVESGKLDLENRDFDLRGMLNDTFAPLSVQAEKKGLEYCCDIAPEVPSLLRGAPRRVRQVLTNLVGNAIKFTEEGKVALEVSRDHEDDDEITLRFVVYDSGIGIAKDKIAFLFEPFTQADASITREFGGTGLGLAICRRLVELMGGEIGARSEKGGGATFWFTIVFGKQSRVQKADQVGSNNDSAGHSAVKTKNQKFRILIVEDNVISRTVLQRVLEKSGYGTGTAANGEEAMSLFASTSFDLVLMDCWMPEMDGFEASRRIRNESSRVNDPTIPIVAMMADMAEGDDERCLQER